MSEPIVFISHQRIKEGKLEGFKEQAREVARTLEETKPGTVVFYAYLNEAGTEATVVHVFPDREAMDAHMEGVMERAQAAYEYIEPQRMEIYGLPSDQTMEVFKQSAEMGVGVTFEPEPLAGYLRLA
ncbi:MAG: putative quinol monooxygenase [Acidimicrobiia bacterium]